MSVDADRFGERLANVEGTIEQMDKRIDDLRSRVDERFNTVDDRFDTMEGQFDRLDAKIDREIYNLRTDIRRWLIVLFTGMSLVVAVVSVIVQLLL